MTVRHSLLSLLATVCMVGCAEGCAGAAGPEEPEQVAVAEVVSGQEEEVAEPIDPGPRPEVRVLGVVDPERREVVLRVENHGDETQLSTAVVLERLGGDEFQPLSDVEVALRYDCSTRADECVTLTRGAVFLPPPWRGTEGHAQCGCADCEDVPAGTYRAVVHSCNLAHRLESAPFELP